MFTASRWLWGPLASFKGIKQPEHEANYSSAFSVQKVFEVFVSLPHIHLIKISDSFD
jgi:hypothetical protein